MYEKKTFINSFPPLVNERCKILLLGSMPGEESLRKQEYYGNPRNQFWPIMIRLLSGSHQLNYNEKLDLLIKNKIALWDVIDNCMREGSLDSNIKEEKLNDFPSFFEEYPHIRNIFFNGKKAFQSFHRISGLSRFNLSCEILPSTSPAYTISIEKKIEEWKKIKIPLKKRKQSL